MNIPVLLEPTATGFRASTGAPLNLSAEAPTADEAPAVVRRAYITKQVAGVRIVALDLPEPDPLLAHITRLAEHPEILDEVDRYAKEYRRQREAEEAAEAAAGEIATDTFWTVSPTPPPGSAP